MKNVKVFCDNITVRMQNIWNLIGQSRVDIFNIFNWYSPNISAMGSAQKLGEKYNALGLALS